MPAMARRPSAERVARANTGVEAVLPDEVVENAEEMAVPAELAPLTDALCCPPPSPEQVALTLYVDVLYNC